MPEVLWWILAGIAVVFAGSAYLWWPTGGAVREGRLARARRDFHLQRERLEAKFIRLAAARAHSGSPHWAACEFDDDVAYVRDRNTRQLSAFVGVTVAVDPHDSHCDLADHFLGQLRVDTAVFRFDRGHWDTDGRTLPNLNPAQAIRLYQNALEVVDQEMAGSR